MVGSFPFQTFHFVGLPVVVTSLGRLHALSMKDDGSVLQSLGVYEGAGVSFPGSGCWELVLQEVIGLAVVLGFFGASELNRSQAGGLPHS